MPTAAKIPDVPYLPNDPQAYRPAIGLIGCGAISKEHLAAYRSAGYRVEALCDLDLAAATARRDAFYPQATLYRDANELLHRKEIEVVDIATHPLIRSELIEQSLLAGKHVLSQKPFVLDLELGRRLVDLAAAQQVQLAVNQNGRWAPHFHYLRSAVQLGLIGEVQSVQMAVHWDHNWIAGTEFEQVRHVILYDFAIHWFDLLCCFFADRQARQVFASFSRSGHQRAKPALLGQAMVEYDCAQASLFFNGDTRYGPLDTTVIVGSEGTLRSWGPNLNRQQVTLSRGQTVIEPKLEGSWFPGGFHGTMGELLCAIEENREPQNSAKNNLHSLALCFAAVASAESGQAVQPGSVMQLPDCGLETL